MKQSIVGAALVLSSLACDPGNGKGGYGRLPLEDFSIPKTPGERSVLLFVKFGEISCGACLGGLESAMNTAMEAVRRNPGKTSLFMVVDPEMEDSAIADCVLRGWAKARGWDVYLTVTSHRAFNGHGIRKSAVTIVDSTGYIWFTADLPLHGAAQANFRSQFED